MMARRFGNRLSMLSSRAVAVALVGWVLAATAPPGAAQAPDADAVADEPRPFARTRLEPGGGVTVGQPVTVIVEVLVPTWFTAAPWFPSLSLDDAIAVYEDRGINFTERIEGETWAAQSRRYHVYPQRAGDFEIESIPIRVRYTSPSTGPRTQVEVSPPPVRFSAFLPEAAAGLPYFISTTELTLDQSFDREPEVLKVGEAFVRTVTVTVKDALSMVVPPLPLESPAGLAAYADPPEVRDEGGERGKQIVGTRVERTTYVAQREGEYRLPAVELTWWDVTSASARTATLAALDVRVEPNLDLAVEIPLPAEDEGQATAVVEPRQRVSWKKLARRWGPPVLALALLAWALFRWGRRWASGLRRELARARRERRESEEAYFGRFRAAARSGDALATWNAWTAWLDRRHAGPGAATVRAFVESSESPALEREAAALERALFAAGGVAEVSTRRLYRELAALRKRRSRPRPASRVTWLNPPSDETVGPLAESG